MRHKLIALAGFVLLVGVGVGLRLAADQTAGSRDGVPIVTVAQPNTLLPDDYPRDDVEMFGQLLNSWDEGLTRVIQYRGDFRLSFGRRRLSADSAVVWVTPELSNGQTLKKFVIYLEGHARVTELEGTTIADTRQVVSLETVGRVWTDAKIRGEAGGGDSDLYRRGQAFRDRVSPAPVARLTAPEEPAEQPDYVPPPPPITFRADDTKVRVRGSERIILAMGNVYVAWASADFPDDPKKYTEIRADRAVLFAKERKVGEAQQSGRWSADLGEGVTGIYLEGDVRLQQGERSIQGKRVYYDRQYDRALILDGVWFQRHESRDVPLVVWFDRLMQMSPGEFRAIGAEITTSAMATPSTSLRAEEVYLQDKTSRPTPYEEVQYDRMMYRAENETFRIRGMPVAWWPGSQGEFGERETALRTLRLGVDSDFGATIESQWHLFRLLNMAEPDGWDLYLNLDAYSSRGPSAGIEGDYQRENYYGELEARGILDRGSDNLGEDEARPDEDEDEDRSRLRGRMLSRHRHYLKNDWELTAEFSYLSDRNYLEEWHEGEFDTGKRQETHVYLKKTWDNNVVTAQALVRINDFLNQTEKLPEVKYYKLGEPLWNNKLAYFGESGIAVLNRAVDDERTDIEDSGLTVRADTRHDLLTSLDAGPVRIVPYATGRLTYWTTGFDEDGIATTPGMSPDTTSGGQSRVFLAAGVKATTMISRTFNNVESRFWDVHRLRHLMKPEINLHLAASSVDRNELQPFDAGVESMHGASSAVLALRQRLQTKRGGPGAWRNVDWMGLDLELALFANQPERTWFEPEFTRPAPTRVFLDDENYIRGEPFDSRPENSLARSTLNWNYWWRISDTMTLLWDGNFGESGLDRWNMGLSVQRDPRLSFYFGQRFIDQLNSNDLIFSSRYQMNRKYAFQFTYVFDTEAGEAASTRFTVVRKFQRWYAALTFDLSQSEDNRQLVMLSIWPEGFPEMTVGQRGNTGVGSTTLGGR